MSKRSTFLAILDTAGKLAQLYIEKKSYSKLANLGAIGSELSKGLFLGMAISLFASVTWILLVALSVIYLHDSGFNIYSSLSFLLIFNFVLLTIVSIIFIKFKNNLLSLIKH